MISEQKVTDAIHNWIDRKSTIPDSVALELFAQYRGSSPYPFSGVSPAGIVDDAESLLSDIRDVQDVMPISGNLARHQELSALRAWVENWQDNHFDVDGDVYEIIPVTGPDTLKGF